VKDESEFILQPYVSLCESTAMKMALENTGNSALQMLISSGYRLIQV